MKFRHAWRPETVSIADAVDAAIDDAYGEGVLERGLSTAQNASRCIGKLVQTLYEKGVLSADDLHDFVSSQYRAVSDDDSQT